MDRVVKITKNGVLVAEIPESMYPLKVEIPVIDNQELWKEKSYTWVLNYWRDEKTYEKLKDKPKGSQLS